MNGNLAGSSLDQSGEPFADIRMFDLQKGGLNQSKSAALGDPARGFAHVIVRFLAPAAVAYNQHAVIYFTHAATPVSENFSCAQYSRKLRASARIFRAASSFRDLETSVCRTSSTASFFNASNFDETPCQLPSVWPDNTNKFSNSQTPS